MEGRNYVFFRNADDSAYMNMASNFRGVNHGTENKIDIYFQSATNADAYDKIICSVADEKEKEACAAVAACLAGNKFDVMAVVADDVASTYVDSNITAVDSITVTAKGSISNAKVLTWSSALELTAADTGALVVTGDTTAGILTLPTAATAGMGWFVDIRIEHAQASAATHISASGNGVFKGGYFAADKDTASDSAKNQFFIPNGSSNDWINLDAATKGNDPGGQLRIICDGTNWHVSGILVGDGNLATAFADAES
jgi:hypothetical protein